MIRNLPVDADRLNLISTGHVTEVKEWAELADGSRKPSGNQARNEARVLLWVVDALVDGEERGEVIGIQIASQVEPQVKRLEPLRLDGLTARVSVGKDGRVRMYWSADGVVGASVKAASQP